MTVNDVRQIFLSGVGWTVIGQLYAILFISGLTFVLLVVRGWRRRQFDRFNSFYGDAIVNELLESDGKDLPLVNTHAPKRHQVFRRAALRTILLNHIRSISGHEKNLLVRSYCALGFANEDRDRCYSPFWGRRLDGVSSLSGLEIHDSAIIFDDLRYDRNQIVSMAATLALSGVRHPKNNPQILDHFTSDDLKRRNLFLQIAQNWARLYGSQFLIVCLHSERREELVRIFVAALAEMNTPEVGSALTKWISESSKRRDPNTLIDILRLLRGIGDPAAIDVASEFLEHPSESVRAEALNLILRIGDPEECRPYIEQMSGDPSLPVQRVLRTVQETRDAKAVA